MIWYDMIWYDMIWYDMIWYLVLLILSCEVEYYHCSVYAYNPAATCIRLDGVSVI